MDNTQGIDTKLSEGDLEQVLRRNPFDDCFIICNSGTSVVFAGDIRTTQIQGRGDDQLVYAYWVDGSRNGSYATVDAQDNEDTIATMRRVIRAIAKAKALGAGLDPSSDELKTADVALHHRSIEQIAMAIRPY